MFRKHIPMNAKTNSLELNMYKKMVNKWNYNTQVPIFIEIYLMTHNRNYLESVVLGEGDDLHDLADPGEDLVDHVQRDGIDHVLHNHA